MKKEGTGKPRNPDIALGADVRVRELYFEETPDPEVRFRGNTRRNSAWGSRRENLPNKVREGVNYLNAGVRLRIASEIVNGDPDSLNSSNKEGESTSLEHRRQKTRVQKTESTGEKE